MSAISFDDFEKVDIRVGRIIAVEEFTRARNPSYKLKIDFGKEMGVKQSSAQLKTDYTPEQLLNSLCLAVVNFESLSPGFLPRCWFWVSPKKGEVCLWSGRTAPLRWAGGCTDSRHEEYT